MAVMQNSIIFGGIDSADFGIYIGGEGTFDAPKRDVEMISIPGRNGAFALDKGRFENIEVTYSAFNFEPDLATFSAQLEAFRNAICSQKGYQRLTDTFHPDEYRMAAYIDGLEIKPIEYNTAATFDITFDCKPQRFLTSGEEALDVDSGDTITNPTLFESSPMLEVTGYGDIQFNGYGINLVSEEYGTVTLKNRFRFGGSDTAYPMPLSNYMAVGDRISIFEVVARFYIDISKAYKGSMQITSASVTSVSEDCTRTITQVAAATLTDDGYVDVILVVRGIAFPFSSAVNNVRERFFIRPNISLTDSNGTTHSMTCTLDIQFYDADYASGARTNKPVFGAYVSFATADQPYFIGIGEAVCSDVVGQSTKSILGTPTYIDCDLGEAYKIEDDTVISLNQYIDLGSDLPKLAVGSNQITFDNTITDLKVVPRWWKI